MMEAGVALQEKVALITDKVTAVIEVLEKVYEDATANKEEKIEAVIQELCKRLIAEVTNIIEYVFDQIAEVALKAVARADEMITGMIGEQFIRNQIEKGINTLFTKYIDVILSTLRGILEKIDWIQKDMVDEIIGSIEESLNAKLDALADSLKESLRSKRSVKDLEDLLFEQNPANYIEECYECFDDAAPYGLAGDLKSALLKVQDVLIRAKTLVTDFQAKVDLVIQTAKDIRQGIHDAAGDQDALEFLMDKVQAEIEKLVLDLIDKVMTEVTSAVRGIIETIDAWISDKFCPFKEKVYQWLDDVILSTVENIMQTIEKVLKLLHLVDNGEAWDTLVDHVTDVAKQKVNDMVEDLRQGIKDKIKDTIKQKMLEKAKEKAKEELKDKLGK